MNLLETMKSRRNTKRFKPVPIDEESLKRVLSAGRLAPTTDNLQPWRLILVRDDNVKRRIAAACGNVKFIAEAPIIIVACGIPDEAYPLVGGFLNSYPIDVSSVMTHITLQATAEGLGTYWVYYFKEEKISEILEVPLEVKVVSLTPLGYPEGEQEKCEGQNVSELVMYDRYG